MPVISKKNALELQKIVKETTGRNITLGEAFALWTHILKLISFFWDVDEKIKYKANQKKLFISDNK